MPRFSISTQASDEQRNAIEATAELSPGCRIITQIGTTAWSDGQLVEVYAECETVEQGNSFLHSLDTFGLLR